MYVDAYLKYDKKDYSGKKDYELFITERHGDKLVERTDIIPVMEYYREDPNGEFVGARGEKCKKLSFTSRADYLNSWLCDKKANVTTENDNERRIQIYRDELERFKKGHTDKEPQLPTIVPIKKVFESDHSVVFRTLIKNYKGTPAPKLRVGYIDIETDFNPDEGFPNPQNPTTCITAITFYTNWDDKHITYVLKPWKQFDGMDPLTEADAKSICDGFTDTHLCLTENELLEKTIEETKKCDLITGWNSERFDLPFIINRIKKVLGKHRVKDLCCFGLDPVETEMERGTEHYKIYKLIGRIHVDYLDLYKKHAPKEHASYKLNSISDEELGEQKVQYEGTLDQLYNQDFRKFIEYNRHDSMLIKKLEDKLKYIEVANALAHENGVCIDSTMGTVAWVDQSLINQAHEMGYVIADRNQYQEDKTTVLINPVDEDNIRAAGAWVSEPKVGLHKWIACQDINSLYPNTIRSLNMSPETIFGQIKQEKTERVLKKKIVDENLYSNKSKGIEAWGLAWADMFGCLEYQDVMNKTDDMLTIKVEKSDLTGREIEIKQSAKELYDQIYSKDSILCLSANGTIFRKDKKGIIPAVLEKWYKERVEMKNKSKEFYKLYEKETDLVKKREHKEQSDYWDLQQYLRKIQLNSLYGALLNEGSKFYDKRLGQSTTLTGRCITQHMTAKTNEIITGKYDYLGETTLAGDTDSNYFTCYNYFKDNNIDFEFTKENVIKYYDETTSKVNESFTEFMIKAFNTSEENGNIIRCGRELCAEAALFVAKKRYAILIYDNEGVREDLKNGIGKLKVKGLDILRSDSSKSVQQFLKEMVINVLKGDTEEQVKHFIDGFRIKFRDLPPWEKGSPKSVKELSKYEQKLGLKNEAMKYIMAGRKDEVTHKVNLPGHVLASINWNKLCQVNADNYSDRISDGTRIVVCKLSSNVYNMTSIAFPVDQQYLPEWFKALTFDEDKMMYSVLDKKIENILGVLKWDLFKEEDDKNTDMLNMFFK